MSKPMKIIKTISLAQLATHILYSLIAYLLIPVFMHFEECFVEWSLDWFKYESAYLRLCREAHFEVVIPIWLIVSTLLIAKLHDEGKL